MMQPLQGSFVALVTPMHSDGSLDFHALKNLVEWHIKSGTTGIVSVGTTGESATVSVSEHLEIIEQTIHLVAGREYIGVDRSTFLVNSAGKIIKEWRGVKVKGHALQVLNAVKEL